MDSRRGAQSTRPRSPGPNTSAPRVLSGHKRGETDHGTPTSEGRSRSTSVTRILNKFMPSRRPERGGTLRDQGFWEEQQANTSIPTQTLPPNRRLKPHPRHGSDSIASSAWNQPVDLPRRTQTTRAQPSVRRGPHADRLKILVPSQEPRGRIRVQEYRPVKTEKVVESRTEVITSSAPPQPVDHRTALRATTVQDTFALFDQKREARRLRRSLKESRDFLGVQGINPHTGVMDVMTPTSSSPSDNTMRSLPELKGYSEAMSDFRAAYVSASRAQDAEEASLALLRKEQERLARLQRHKNTIRTFQHRVRWQKEGNQWSSVAEPDLSPITDRSVKTRSTSVGAETPPLGPVRHTRGRKRALTTPTGMQTIALAAASGLPPTSHKLKRPEIIARDSSGTVIHTPVDNNTGAQRRFSVLVDMLGSVAKKSSSKVNRVVSEPANSAEAHGSPSKPLNSDYVVRRKPVAAGSPVANRPALQLVIPDSMPQPHQTTNGHLNYQGPFLGARTELGSARTYCLPKMVNMSSPTTEPMTEMEESTAGHPSYPERKANSMRHNAQAQDITEEMMRQLAFAEHLSRLERPTALPPVPIFGPRRNTHEVRATHPAQRPLRYRVPPVPRRLASEPAESSRYLSIPPEVPPKPFRAIPPKGLPSPDPLMSGAVAEDQDLACGWAEQLIQDIEGLGRTQEKARLEDLSFNKVLVVEDPPATMAEATGSAYTHTITTTGYDRGPPRQAQGLFKENIFDGPGNDVSKEDLVISKPILPGQVRVPVTEGEEMSDLPTPSPKTARRFAPSLQAQTSYDLLASPPRLPPNTWPSLVISHPPHRPLGTTTGGDARMASPFQVGTVPERQTGRGTGTTLSAHQLRPTRQRYERLCRRVSRLDHGSERGSRATSSTQASRDRSRERATKSDNTMPAKTMRAASPTSTSTPQQQQSSRSFTPYLGATSSSSSASASSTSVATKSEGEGHPRHRQLAQEAARTALMGKTAAARIVQVSIATRKPSAVPVQAAAGTSSSPKETGNQQTQRETGPGRKKKGPKETGNRDGADDDTGGPSKSKSDPGSVRRVPLKDEQASKPLMNPTSALSETAFRVLSQFVAGYWTLVAPVFNSGSPISTRLAARESTLRDFVVYLLALAFALLGFLLAVWTVRGLVLVAGVVRAVYEGMLVLIGF